MQKAVRWIHALMRLVLVVLLAVPVLIGFQVAGMLLTGWGTQGVGWIVIGALWIPTFIAFLVYLVELRSFKQALGKAFVLGVAATVTLLLVGTALIIYAGPLDGGI